MPRPKLKHPAKAGRAQGCEKRAHSSYACERKVLLISLVRVRANLRCSMLSAFKFYVFSLLRVRAIFYMFYFARTRACATISICISLARVRAKLCGARTRVSAVAKIYNSLVRVRASAQYFHFARTRACAAPDLFHASMFLPIFRSHVPKYTGLVYQIASSSAHRVALGILSRSYACVCIF